MKIVLVLLLKTLTVWSNPQFFENTIQKIAPESLSTEEQTLLTTKLQKLDERFPVVQQTGSIIRDSEISKYIDLEFTYQSAEDLVFGYSVQLLNEIFLYNLDYCTFWTFDTFSDFINGILLLIEDNAPLQSFLSFSYSYHKAPVAYFSCLVLLQDYKEVVDLYGAITTSPTKWGPFGVKVCWNIFFNLIDLAYELLFLMQGLEEQNWQQIGENLAKMTSDVFIKSTISPSWDYKNSDEFKEDWDEPYSLLNDILMEVDEIAGELGMEPVFFPNKENEEDAEQSDEQDSQNLSPENIADSEFDDAADDSEEVNVNPDSGNDPNIVKPEDATTPNQRPKVKSMRDPTIIKEKKSEERTDKILQFNDCLIKKNGPEDMKKVAKEIITTFKRGHHQKVDEMLKKAIEEYEC